MFEMPLSPFEAEKRKIGDGFLARRPFRVRSKPERIIPRSKVGTPRPHLSDADKEYIGSTGRETPTAELAERFGIPRSYVLKLRDRYRYPDRRKKRRYVA